MVKRVIVDDVQSVCSSFLFKSQAALKHVIKDELMALFKGLDRSSKIVRGTLPKDFHEELYELQDSIEKEVRSVGDAAGKDLFSVRFTKNEIGSAFRYIVEEQKEFITSYVGKQFLHKGVLAWRNYPIDKNFENFDVYSNVWHQDSHDGNRLLKIFILLQDVSIEDGPFTFLSEKDTRKNWGNLRKRYHMDTSEHTKSYLEEQHATGSFGDYIILDTARSAHRATVPAASRDMAQLTMYPSWQRKSGRLDYKSNIANDHLSL